VTITDEMVDALCQALDHDISGSQAKIALEAVAPLLIAQGLREAVELLGRNRILGRQAILARAQELDPK